MLELTDHVHVVGHEIKNIPSPFLFMCQKKMRFKESKQMLVLNGSLTFKYIL